MTSMTEQSSPTRSRGIDPLSIWRWGFGIVLLIAGVWLVVAAPAVGDADGRVMGWVLIGYAVLRLVLGKITRTRHKKLAPTAHEFNPGESA